MIRCDRHASCCHCTIDSSKHDGKPDTVQLDIYKPITSKANNSETYIVARGFRGISDELLHGLLEHVGEDIYESNAMLAPSDMPKTFLDSVRECGKVFAARTQEAIERTLAWPALDRDEVLASRDVQEMCSKKWLEDFKLILVPAEQRLSPVCSYLPRALDWLCSDIRTCLVHRCSPPRS